MALQTVGQVATLLELSERQVYELAKRGTIPRAERGRYDLIACVRAYVRHLREVAAGRASDDGRSDIVAERARLAAAQADQYELKNAQLRGDLVPADDIESASVAIHSAVQRRLLAVPRNAAPLVAVENDARACENIIREHIEEALEEIADLQLEVEAPETDGAATASSKRKDGRRNARGVQAPTQAHRKSVGRSRKASKP